MAILTVLITSSLIEDSLKIGKKIRKCSVLEGLPNDAKIKWAGLADYGRTVELKFSTKEISEDKIINIVIKEEES